MTDDEIGKQMMDDELGPARMVVETPGADELVARCINYLASGGLFNPECMDPRTVRDLVIACRATIAAQEKEIARYKECAAVLRSIVKESDDWKSYDQCCLGSFEFMAKDALAALDKEGE